MTTLREDAAHRESALRWLCTKVNNPPRRFQRVPRPFSCRRIAGRPAASIFKPVGIPVRELEEVVMTLDEFEAMRLASLDGLYQEQAAEQMNISRPTFSRIIESAHRKMADALVHGKALRIEGGPVQLQRRRCCRMHDEGGE
jgi:predicted DNA-binding protein (UPF0251 family)